MIVAEIGFIQYVLELKIMHYQHGFARFANIDIYVFHYSL